MKIAIFSDPHLGYARFEEDSYLQAERVILDASEKADLILCAGDLFDVKIPKLETLKRAIDIFKKAKVKTIIIHGNHERRPKDLTNPVQLVASGAGITVLHGNDDKFEKNGERVQVLGIGSVPEEYADTAVKSVMAKFSKTEGAFRILMLHQSIRELMPNGKDELALEYLETLPFDLIINGHIHETITRLDGRFLIPGSTVITQLKEIEMLPKGYFLYDTATRKAEFVPVETRKFIYEVIEFKDANDTEIRERIRTRVAEIKKQHPEAIVAIKVDGTLKEGLTNTDVSIEEYDNVFIDNRLNSESLGAKLERIRAVREENMSLKEVALRELKAKTDGKVTRFNSAELFDKLLQGPEEATVYLENSNKENGGK